MRAQFPPSLSMIYLEILYFEAKSTEIERFKRQIHVCKHNSITAIYQFCRLIVLFNAVIFEIFMRKF